MSTRFPILWILALLLSASPALAQQYEAAAGEEPAHNLGVYESIDLPTPNRYRAANGEPGTHYWQNSADYAIDVTLDPEAHRISGSETITYTNHSPQPLERLWVQLDQNLFAEGSRGSRLLPPDSRWRGSFEGGGYTIENVRLTYGDAELQPEMVVRGTRMQLPLERPLESGETVELSLDFAFTIPNYGADRMGRLDVEDGTVYELAQWYPRMYVYDDVHGWNPLPYLGQGEFYLDYGDFEIEITAPKEFVVFSTGELLNENEVLNETQLERLGRARQSAETVHIITPEEAGTDAASSARGEMATWRFRAENVRDVAWTASDAFIWDAAGYEDVLVQSFYPREGIGTEENPGWEESTEYVRHSIAFYSDFVSEYPYPTATNVAGIVGGMEYPMIVFCSVRARDRGLFGVTDHEFGHEWFPMIVGSDERRYAWMDEGFNTFINHYSTLAYYGDEARTDRFTGAYMARQMQSPIADQPVFTFPDRIRRSGLGFLAYRKPGYGLYLLREYILEPEVFDLAFREYVDRWAYKHPKPADFFRTIEDVTGEDLDWFWRGWFMTTDTFDQAVAAIDAQEERSTVTIMNEGDLILPPTLKVTYADGTTETVRVPAEAFFTTDRFTVTVPGSIIEAELDPNRMLPDVDRSDDRWLDASSDEAR